MNMFAVLVNDLMKPTSIHPVSTKDRIMYIIKRDGVTTKGALMDETACSSHYVDNVLRNAAYQNVITVRGLGRDKVVTHKQGGLTQ